MAEMGKFLLFFLIFGPIVEKGKNDFFPIPAGFFFRAIVEKGKKVKKNTGEPCAKFLKKTLKV